MNSEGENKLKIRFRLPNGEEFEAEGPQPFIEQQRNYFLTLIGAQAGAGPAVFPNTQGGINTPATGGINCELTSRPATGGANQPAAKLPYNTAPYQAGTHNAIAHNTTPLNTVPQAAPYNPLATEHCPAQAPGLIHAQPHETAQGYSAEILFWERIFKQENGVLALRYKAKLAPQELAVLLLAAARVILKKDTYSALELAKSFKASGGPEGRLDRFLTAELQAGRIIAQGAKRSRTYHLSDEGFARAFVLAEKLQK